MITVPDLFHHLMWRWTDDGNGNKGWARRGPTWFVNLRQQMMEWNLHRRSRA